MLLLGLWLCVITGVLAVEQVRIAKLNERIRELEQERDMWRLAAEFRAESEYRAITRSHQQEH